MLKAEQRTRLLALPRTQLDAVWKDLRSHYPSFPTEPDDATPEMLADLLTARRMDHASLLSPMFRETAPDAVSAIEGLLGKPITRPQARTRAVAQTFNGRAPRPRAADNRIISNVVPNPKKPNSASYTRFSLYRENMTVSEALAAGVTMADIRWDSDRGFICLA